MAQYCGERAGARPATIAVNWSTISSSVFSPCAQGCAVDYSETLLFLSAEENHDVRDRGEGKLASSEQNVELERILYGATFLQHNGRAYGYQ
jgi:hypothetical protein